MCRYCHQPIPIAGQEPATAPSERDLKKLWYCDRCGYLGNQRRYTKGSFGLELFLYLLMILPGVIYTLWRLTSKYKGCPKCATPNMMPATSPKALTAIQAAQRPA
jgi:ribosomal protein S27AE